MTWLLHVLMCACNLFVHALGASFFITFFMVALWNRADHYIVILWFLSIKDVNESRNARVSKKILVLENLISRRARNSRTHKAKLCCPNKQPFA